MNCKVFETMLIYPNQTVSFDATTNVCLQYFYEYKLKNKHSENHFILSLPTY